jgi:hypothetical protein
VESTPCRRRATVEVAGGCRMEFKENVQEANGISATGRSAAPGAGKVIGARGKMHSLLDRILRKIFPDERKSERYQGPPLVGHLGMAHNSRPFEVADISVSGFCLLTDERWETGTEMPITLRRTDLPEGSEAEGFTVQATVTRRGAGSVGFSIALVEQESHAILGNPLHVRWITRGQMQEFLNRIKGPVADQGNAQEETRINTGVQVKPGLKAAFEGGD